MRTKINLVQQIFCKIIFFLLLNSNRLQGLSILGSTLPQMRNSFYPANLKQGRTIHRNISFTPTCILGRTMQHFQPLVSPRFRSFLCVRKELPVGWVWATHIIGEGAPCHKDLDLAAVCTAKEKVFLPI